MTGSETASSCVCYVLGLAEKVEALARLYWQSLQVGEPALLDGVEMARVVDKFRTYGQ